jgi:predicted esterase
LVIALFALGMTAAIGVPALIYHWANGITFGSVAVSSAAFAFALLAIPRRKARLTAAVLLALDGTWAVARIARPGAEGLQVCEDGACDGRGHFWQRVPDEREAARFGLYLSRLTGTMVGREADRFDALLDSEYARLPEAWRGLPNALLLQQGQRLQWVPPGATKLPCIVFLHGFGGEVTLYLNAMVSSELGQKYIIVAPVLDNAGGWWSDRGIALVRHTLETLPEQADGRVVLVGLSNGSIGATRMLFEPRIRSRISGAMLISGIGEVPTGSRLDGAAVYVVSGTQDPRFKYAWVEERAQALRSAGADVVLKSFDADHFLILTHAREWTTLLRY